MSCKSDDEYYKYQIESPTQCTRVCEIPPTELKSMFFVLVKIVIRNILFFVQAVNFVHKHIMLQGAVGTGKTLLMQIFSEYLRITENPRYFYNLSVTQMVNYYTLHNNLDRYTFNEEENKGFQCMPVNICLNDIGVQSTKFYGTDTETLTSEFLHARNEIWTQYHKMAHLTTNLTTEQLKQKYKDGFGRLLDRFKTYNVIPLAGESRR